MSTLGITGNLRKRYIQAAALLCLLDPVRGEPTTYGLDHDSCSLQDPLDRVLKRRFLDSFALICATHKKNSDAISAACLDKDSPNGTVVRIASNAGVSESTLGHLRDILSFLSDIATKSEAIHYTECEIKVLYKIIILDISKIRDYLSDLRKSRKFLRETGSALQSRLMSALPRATPRSIQDFVEWFTKISSIPDDVTDLDAEDLIGWIQWAQKARQVHIDLLRAAFLNGYNSLQRWVSYVLKLGRYWIAAKNFVKIAAEIPSMFSHITVEAITHPPSVQFGFLEDEMPLISVLRRVPEIKADDTIKRLAKIWNTNDAEACFRHACSTDLAAHAELQLVSFYDENRHLKPHSRFIGVSKKSCYLCYSFLTHHPAGFVVSSCHQKMYFSIPPPAKTSKVYQQWTKITTLLCVRMETIAREELIERFGLKRSPIPLDSTAGMSVTNSIDSKAWQVLQFEDFEDIVADSEVTEDSGASLYIANVAPVTHSPSSSWEYSPSPIRQGSRSSMITIRSPNSAETEMNTQHPSLSRAVSSIVFHVRTLDGEMGDDLIMIDSILDPSTHMPLWSRFIRLLNSGDNNKALFRATDHLVINSQIRVHNERQFIACLQYLVNSGVLNAEVTIYNDQALPDKFR